MRGGIIVLGIILLVLGIFLYFTGNNMINEVEAYDFGDIPISEFLKQASEDVRRQYEGGESMVMFGTIFGIVGFIVCITGMIAPNKLKEVRESNGGTKKPSIAECELCGKMIDTKDLEVYDVDGKELFLCEKCGNQVTGKSKEISETEDESLKILKLRYAKGEITNEEFEKMKKNIGE